MNGGGPLAASSAMIAEFVGDLTSPSQAAQRAESLAQLERCSTDWTRPIARCWPCATSRS